MKCKILILSAIALSAMGCKSTRPAAVSDQPPLPAPVLVQVPVRGGQAALPKAVIYKTNGNFNDYVTANYDAATGSFISYPGPGDVSAQSEPLPLDGGWLLDRRGGIGPNTVFLRWTYAEYHALPAVPSVDELRDAIIPGARVTAWEVLPMTASEAIASPESVNAFLNDK